MRQPHRDWLSIRQEYESNPISLRTLADKHQINSSYILRRAAKEHWTKFVPSVSSSVSNPATLVYQTPSPDTLATKQNKQTLGRSILASFSNPPPKPKPQVTEIKVSPKPDDEWNPLDSP